MRRDRCSQRSVAHSSLQSPPSAVSLAPHRDDNRDVDLVDCESQRRQSRRARGRLPRIRAPRSCVDRWRPVRRGGHCDLGRMTLRLRCARERWMRTTSTLVAVLSFLCLTCALCVSVSLVRVLPTPRQFVTMWQHHKHNAITRLRHTMIIVLGMVPVYSICAWWGLFQKQRTEYWDLLRECYGQRRHSPERESRSGFHCCVSQRRHSLPSTVYSMLIARRW